MDPSAPPIPLDVARAAIEHAFADVDTTTVEHIGSGWEFDAFLSADGWVFRFPRHDDAAALIEHDRSVAELVRPHLREAVSIPLISRVAPPGVAFPRRFAAHRHVAGTPLDRIPERLYPSLARSLGEILGAIHAVPIDEARAAGVAPLDRPDADRRAWLDGGLAGLTPLVGSGTAIDRAVAWVRAEPDPIRRLDAPVRFIHQDLSVEHLLADPATGRVVGVLDWSDATLGDPARDFVIVVAFGGWRFAEAALDAYPHDVDAGFRGRLRFMARLLSAMWLGWANAAGEDLTRHRAWVENAWRDE